MKQIHIIKTLRVDAASTTKTTYKKSIWCIFMNLACVFLPGHVQSVSKCQHEVVRFKVSQCQRPSRMQVFN